jgi:hypothetical protein
MNSIDLKIIHFTLLVVILFLFSKLSIDAIILGAVAIYLYQRRGMK